MSDSRKIFEELARANDRNRLLSGVIDSPVLKAAAGLDAFKNLDLATRDIALGAGMRGYDTGVMKLATGSEFIARTELARSALGMSASLTASRLAEAGMFDHRTLATLAAIQLPTANLGVLAAKLAEIQSVERAITGASSQNISRR